MSSVTRYNLEDALRDINIILASQQRSMGFGLVLTEGRAQVTLEHKTFPALVRRVYTVGGRLYLLVSLLGKTVKLEFSGDSFKMYDSSRRELAGLTLIGNRLVLKGSFQNPELAH